MTTLKKGDKAPNFSGLDQDGKLHQLADYAGKKLVVFFYPKTRLGQNGESAIKSPLAGAKPDPIATNTPPNSTKGSQTSVRAGVSLALAARAKIIEIAGHAGIR